MLASNLPDIDVVLWARGDAEYLLFHRGFTHSLLGLALLPPLLAAALWWGLGRRTPLGWLLLLSWAGALLHVLYDLLTPWGTMLLYPFSVARLSLDWIFIVDVATWILPALALVAARRWPARSRAAAVASFAIFAAYAALAGLAHRAAREGVVAAERAEGRATAETFAFPLFGGPWRWEAFAVAPAGAPEPRIARYPARGVPPRPGPPERIASGMGDPWAERAVATRAGQSYLWWAAVPVARVAEGPDTVRVTLSDLRFHRSIVPTAEGAGPFSLHLDFDPRSGRLLGARW